MADFEELCQTRGGKSISKFEEFKAILTELGYIKIG